MSDKSGISWTSATWNPVTGCDKVSQACKFCYAERDWGRLSSNPKTIYFGRKFTDVAVHEERLDQPLRWTKKRLIFVNSMSDLFHKDVPIEFIDKVFAIMALAYVTMDDPHVFQVLTKRPELMHAYLNDSDTVHRVTKAMKELGPKGGLPGENSPPTWPLPNVWIGVSVEDQEAADARIPILLDTPAAIRWISAEPLLGAVDINRWLMTWQERRDHIPEHIRGRALSELIAIAAVSGNNSIIPMPALDWVVVGGESGSNARPMHPKWVMDILDQCTETGTPFFF